MREIRAKKAYTLKYQATSAPAPGMVLFSLSILMKAAQNCWAQLLISPPLPLYISPHFQGTSRHHWLISDAVRK